MKLNKGFTLIELLIVIAIIGILAAILLPNLLAARVKAQDSKRQGEISGIRAEAELHYDTGSTYVGMCASAKVTAIRASAETGGADTDCYESASAYAIDVDLMSDGVGNISYCVDSTGYGGKTAAPLAANATVCTP